MVDTSPYSPSLRFTLKTLNEECMPASYTLAELRREGVKHQNLCTSQLRVEAHSMPHEWHT